MRGKLLSVAVLILAMADPFPATGQCGQDIEVEIVKGDTLISICETYLDDPGDWPVVAKANHIVNPNRIYAKQRIVIPAWVAKGEPLPGTATFVKGSVEIQPEPFSPWRPIARNETVAQGSRLRTGGDGALEVTFEDGSSFYMKPETMVDLKKARVRGMVYVLRELVLEAGRVITHIRKITGQESRFDVVTPAATAGARGTDFRTASDHEAVTRVEVLSGTVDARSGRNTVVLHPGEGTIVEKGKRPDPPTPLLPPPAVIEPEAIHQRLPLEFRFSDVPGAVSYRLTLAADESFRQIVFEQVVQPTVSARIPHVDDGLYHMQVQSISASGLEGLPSPTVPVRIRIHPVPPFVSKPVNGREYRTVTMSFDWLKVPDAVEYELQIASDKGFHTIVHDRRGIRKTSCEVSDLPFSSYFFRVRSVARDGYRGVWSDEVRFTLSPPPPAPPTEAAQLSDNGITIRWADQGPDITYHFQIAEDPEFSRILKDERLAASEITLDRPRTAGTYYIRVSAIDADGCEGRFSPVQILDLKHTNGFWTIAMTIGIILIVLIP